MLKRTEEYIRKYNMIQSGDYVVVGVSGGADSVCLLDILNKLAKKLDFELIAVHVNHMIRGDEACRDEEYVKHLCAEYGVRLVCHQVDVVSIAKEYGESVEEAGRRVRYECFENVEGATKIAVAHHADDQAETVIHNIVRGSSLKGAGGIRPARGKIIRPLLWAERAGIEEYLKETGINFCVDSTNLSGDYTRNKIRRNVIPELLEVNQNAVANINDFAGDLRECYEFVKGQAESIYNRCLRKISGEAIVLDVSILLNQQAIIRREVIMMAVKQLAGSLKDITRKHVSAAEELIFKEVSKRVDLPYGMIVVRGYDTIEVRAKEHLQETNEKPELSMIVEEFDGDWEKLTNDYTKVFDYAKIKGGLILRKRMPGDYIVIDDDGRKKSLKKFFIDAKVPKEQRDRIWLLAEGNHILWVIGYRTGSACKTDSNTKKILKITLRRNGYDI